MTDQDFLSSLFFIVCISSIFGTAGAWWLLTKLSQIMDRRSNPFQRKGKSHV
jgi:hypothetical protein